MSAVSYADVIFIAGVCALIWGMMALMNRSRRVHPARQPAIPDRGAADALLSRVLSESRSVAVVGRFDSLTGAEARVVRFLSGAGYVTHAVGEEAGENRDFPVYARLEDLPVSPDLVVIVLPAPLASAWARSALDAGARGLWLEKGTVDPEAMHIAREGEIAFVMDHSIEEEYRRLIGPQR